MTKPVIVKRGTKGSHLTFTELDNNFQNLSDATFSIQAGTGGTVVSSDLNDKITLVAGTGITITGNDSTNQVTITGNAPDIVNDTTPQLGGDLDVNGYSIISTSNGNITIAPNGTGTVLITKYREGLYASDSTSTSFTPDFSKGAVQLVTANASFTLNLPINSPGNGTGMTLIMKQDATGNRVMTANTTYKWLGGQKVLSTAANSYDMIHIFHVTGTTYLCSLNKGYI